MKYSYLDIYNNQLENKTFLSDEIKRFYGFSINYYKDKLDKRTLYLFIRHIEGFEKFMFYHFPEIQVLNNIKEIHIEEFRDFCIEGLKNSKKTVNSKLTSLRYFFKYLTEEELINYNITLNVKKFKIREKDNPTHFKSSDLKILFYEMRKFKYGIRDVVISKIVLTMGLEIKDILNLKISELNLDNKMIITSNKAYPIGDSLYMELKDYLYIREKINTKDSEYLFLSKSGTEYSIRSFQLLFKKAMTNTNIPLKLSPRFLRTTFLYNMAKVIEEDELKLLSNQEKVGHYYKLLENPLQTII